MSKVEIKDYDGNVLKVVEGADLRYADLQGADLEGANLRGADLMYANLEGANLRGTNFRYADLTGTILEGLEDRLIRRSMNMNPQDIRNAHEEYEQDSQM